MFSTLLSEIRILNQKICRENFKRQQYQCQQTEQMILLVFSIHLQKFTPPNFRKKQIKMSNSQLAPLKTRFQCQQKEQSSKKNENTDWNVRQRIIKNKYRQIELRSRVNILQMKKKQEFKSIQTILSKHRINVQSRIIDCHHEQRFIKTKHQKDQQRSQNKDEFRSLRSSRHASISEQKLKILDRNRQSFSSHKKAQSQFHSRVFEQRKQILQQKIRKRNKVRNMQSNSQYRVGQFWDKKVQMLKTMRSKQLATKIAQDNQIKIKLRKLQINQNKLEDQIQETKKIKRNIKKDIEVENKMNNKSLTTLYSFSRPNFRKSLKNFEKKNQGRSQVLMFNPLRA